MSKISSETRPCFLTWQFRAAIVRLRNKKSRWHFIWVNEKFTFRKYSTVASIVPKTYLAFLWFLCPSLNIRYYCAAHSRQFFCITFCPLVFRKKVFPKKHPFIVKYQKRFPLARLFCVLVKNLIRPALIFIPLWFACSIEKRKENRKFAAWNGREFFVLASFLFGKMFSCIENIAAA